MGGDVDYVKEQHYGSQKSPRLFRLRPAIGERSGFHQGARTTVILEIIDVLKEMVGRRASEVWCSRFAQYLNILGDTSAIFNSRAALDIDPARVLTTEVENDGVKQHRLRVFNAGFLSVPRSLGGAGRVPGTLLPSNSDAVNAAMLGGDWSDGLDRRGRLPLESLIHLSLIIPKADPLTLPFGYEGAAQDYLKAGFNVVVAGRHPVIDGYILDVSGGVALVLQSRQAMNTTGLFSETGVDVTTLFDFNQIPITLIEQSTRTAQASRDIARASSRALLLAVASKAKVPAPEDLPGAWICQASVSAMRVYRPEAPVESGLFLKRGRVGGISQALGVGSHRSSKVAVKAGATVNLPTTGGQAAFLRHALRSSKGPRRGT